MTEHSEAAAVSLERAIEFLTRGEYLKANALLRRLLATNRNDADALHLLGVSECRLGGVGDGQRIMESAIQLDSAEVFQGNLRNWRSLTTPKGPYQNEFINMLHEFSTSVGDSPEDSEAWDAALNRLLIQVASKGISRTVGAAHAFAKQLMFTVKNFNYNPIVNGERWLLARLVPFRPQVIFDVGANHGEWSALAALYHPQASIHAFEIVPATRRKLDVAVSDTSNVAVHPFGLSNRDEDVQVYHHLDFDQTSSMIKDGDAPCALLTAPVRRGDAVAAELGVSMIDILKIDVEGAEMMVMEGFSDLISAGKVSVIQFEYGRISISTRTLLKDYYSFLTSNGMKVGKLFPEGVEFGEYSQFNEDFLGPNYVACRADRPDLIDALLRVNGYLHPV